MSLGKCEGCKAVLRQQSTLPKNSYVTFRSSKRVTPLFLLAAEAAWQRTSMSSKYINVLEESQEQQFFLRTVCVAAGTMNPVKSETRRRMGKLLEVKNLIKKYHEGTATTRVIDNIDLDVDEQEFVMIMGASGSGKTSLLHLIAGIDHFDEGTIHFKNVDFGCMSENAKTVFRRSNIGIVFQQHCLVPDLTVYENIMLPIMLDRSKGKTKRKDPMKDTIINLCRQFGLEEHVKKYPSQLSGGQQQRAAILRSIANRPSLLLCDEPTGSLNSAHTEIVMRLLEWLNKKGQTILLVTHDIKVAVRGKRVIYIKDGRIGGEMRFSETDGDGVHQKEILSRREEELMNFLQRNGW